MVLYSCPRCLYNTNQKNDIRKHFKRTKICKPINADIDLELCYKQVLGDEKFKRKNKNPNIKKCDNFVTKSLKSSNFCDDSVTKSLKSLKSDKLRQNSLKSDDSVTKSLNFCDNFVTDSLKFCDNYVTKSLKTENETLKFNHNYYEDFMCPHCDTNINSINNLEVHIDNTCQKVSKFTNIYSYDGSTFGSQTYGKGGGDLFCIQLDFFENSTYHIGVIANLYNKMRNYRKNSFIEPKLLFYSPISNIKEASTLLKDELNKYYKNKEEFKLDINTVITTFEYIQTQLNCTHKLIYPKFKYCSNVSCLYCGLKTNSYDMLYNHLSNCDIYLELMSKKYKKIFNENVPSLELISHSKTDIYTQQEVYQMNKELENKDIELSNKNHEIAELKKQVETLILSNSNHPHIQGDVNVNNIVCNINIHPFGSEQTDYITNEKIEQIVSSEPLYAIPNILKLIHFNPEHPENSNIYIPNKKESYVRTWDGNKWRLQKKQQIITDMAYNALTLTEKTDDVFDEKFRKIKDGYYDGDKKTVSSIHKETELMILNEGNDVGKLITY